LYVCIPFETIDAHGLKIQERGYLMFLPKSLVGVSRLSGKIAWRGTPILGFIAFLLTSFSKICLGERVLFYPPPPGRPPLCASMFETINFVFRLEPFYCIKNTNRTTFYKYFSTLYNS
jgi:hypothetical protein